jgi:hypothetical protein
MVMNLPSSIICEKCLDLLSACQVLKKSSVSGDRKLFLNIYAFMGSEVVASSAYAPPTRISGKFEIEKQIY